MSYGIKIGLVRHGALPMRESKGKAGMVLIALRNRERNKAMRVLVIISR
jgi:hypothetical protein